MFGQIYKGKDTMERKKLVTWAQYCAAAKRTANPALEPDDFFAGLVGEMGELVEIWKKVRHDDWKLDRGKLIAEAGDVLWYLAASGGDPINQKLQTEWIGTSLPEWMPLQEAVFWYTEHAGTCGKVIGAVVYLVRCLTGDRVTDEELFSEIALANMAKLAGRFPNGYAPGGGNR